MRDHGSVGLTAVFHSLRLSFSFVCSFLPRCRRGERELLASSIQRKRSEVRLRGGLLYESNERHPPTEPSASSSILCDFLSAEIPRGDDAGSVTVSETCASETVGGSHKRISQTSSLDRRSPRFPRLHYAR